MKTSVARLCDAYHKIRGLSMTAKGRMSGKSSNVGVKLKSDELDLIERAVSILDTTKAEFLRTCALIEAQKVIEKKEK